jgi:hypothetical protein
MFKSRVGICEFEMLIAFRLTTSLFDLDKIQTGLTQRETFSRVDYAIRDASNLRTDHA